MTVCRVKPDHVMKGSPTPIITRHIRDGSPMSLPTGN